MTLPEEPRATEKLDSSAGADHRPIVGIGLAAATVVLLFAALRPAGEQTPWNELEVTATAYNSLPSQTTRENSDLAAWGDTLKPGMQAIAVSRDLLKLGLGRGTVVQIDGLPGDWVVLDKMHKRWEKKIDIYLGVDVYAAREWGKRQVVMRWRSAPEVDSD